MTQQPATINLPPIGALVRRAGRPMLESALIPLLVFWILFSQLGLHAGMIGAFGWSALVIVTRLVQRRGVPTVLLVTTTLLVARTVVGLWSGSALLYFLQPTIQNFAFAALLLLAVGFNRPLLAKLADDFCAFPDALTSHPEIQRFFRKVSVLWAIVFLTNGVTTLAVLATMTVNSYLVVSTAGSYSMVALGVGVSLWWFRRGLARHGISIRMGAAAAA